MDIMPTLLAAAGVKVPAGHKLDGVNLLSALVDGESLDQRQLFWNGKAMRDGTWKLIVDGKGGDKLDLYNLQDDLGEKNNLAETQMERVESMLASLETWKKDVANGEVVQPRDYADQQAKKAKALAPKKKRKKK